jgi:UDPglucose 6-dehydrogenase
MNVSIVGAGHVGLVTGACLAKIGHRVLCVDRDAARVELLKAGRTPFYEPGLDELVREGLSEGRLSFSTSSSQAAEFASLTFICVPTPPTPRGGADLSYVDAVALDLAPRLRGFHVVVEKSTVPVNTGERLRELLGRAASPDADIEVASNPEFLREGSAVKDFLQPDRVVLGVRGARAERLLRDLYEPLRAPLLVTDVASAELIKHASNSFLALKISYINAVAEICERAGACVTDVARGMGLDPRIGKHFLNAGIGYGGSCFPKDVAAFAAIAEDLGCPLPLLREVERLNDVARERFVRKVARELGGVQGRVIAALGLSFKPDTDDLRESASLKVAQKLHEMGARVRTFDPVVNGHTLDHFPAAIPCRDPYEAAAGADCALLLTEWDEFRRLDLDRLRGVMTRPLLIDGRNFFDPEEVRARGFTYHSVGRQ